MNDIVFRVGDCLDIFGAEPDESLDAFVSDPPAGIAFMGREWDGNHGHRDKWIAFWRERFALARRKARPGAYSLTWALPRTAHWTMCALDDAGWQIQDVIAHAFGQGWPKGKSALKPASEHWILARNGSGGALQIDAARVPRGERPHIVALREGTGAVFGANANGSYNAGTTTLGSWPPNLLDYADPDGLETVPAFDCLAACDCGATVLAPSGGAAPRCVPSQGLHVPRFGHLPRGGRDRGCAARMVASSSRRREADEGERGSAGGQATDDDL